MAKRTVKSGLASKVDKAVKKHRNDETTYSGGSDLPPGIEGGVARLEACKFDVYKKGPNTGKDYFYASGVVVSPKVFDGIPIEGQRTSIMEPICDTPGRTRADIDDHVEWVLNEMRKLGADTKEADGDSLESIAEALQESQPYFRFRTWRGEATKEFPTPTTRHDWRGHCDFVADGEDAVEDETAEEEEEEDTPEDDEEQTLGELADAGDGDAIAKIKKLAKTAEVDPDDYDTWVEVEGAINTGDDADTEDEEQDADEDVEDDDEEEDDAEEEDEDEEEEFLPAKGDIYLYKPPKSKKAIECQITAVVAGKQLVTLKNLDDGKTVYKGVSWNALESA